MVTLDFYADGGGSFKLFSGEGSEEDELHRWAVNVILVCGIGFGLMGASKAEDAAQLKLQLMTTTKIGAVADFSGTPEKFVEDNDPNTLEIVFLSKPEFGPSRVSDDGEVIFITPDATDDEQQALIGKAFDIRVQRRLQKSK